MQSDIEQMTLNVLVSEIAQRVNDNPDLALTPILQNLESTLRILAQDAHMSRTGEL